MSPRALTDGMATRRLRSSRALVSRSYRSIGRLASDQTMPCKERVHPLEPLHQMLRLHPDADADMVLNAEPASGDDENAFLFSKLVRKNLREHVEIVAKKCHPSRCRALPG